MFDNNFSGKAFLVKLSDCAFAIASLFQYKKNHLKGAEASQKTAEGRLLASTNKRESVLNC